MYTRKNFKTKKALKEAIAAGERVEIFNPGAPMTSEAPRDGKVTLEGPHFPEPHRWYAEAVVKDGALVSVK